MARANLLAWMVLFVFPAFGSGLSELQDPRRYPDGRAPDPGWSYGGKNGPSFWGLIPGNESCQRGLSQSPVAIEPPWTLNETNTTFVTEPDGLRMRWEPSALTLFHNGRTVQALYDSGSATEFRGATYPLRQFHFHSPAEHLVAGREAPLEAHFVHTGESGTLVVAVFFEEGPWNEELAKIIHHTPATIGTTPVPVPGLEIEAAALLPSHSAHFHYVGSLTTPPCTEGVKWIVLLEPITASRAQLHWLNETLVGPNNRPVAARNGRTIEFLR